MSLLQQFKTDRAICFKAYLNTVRLLNGKMLVQKQIL